MVGFFEAPDGLPDAVASGRGCVTAAPDLIANIRDHPGDYYVNLHDAAFPGGSIRGQLRHG